MMKILAPFVFFAFVAVSSADIGTYTLKAVASGVLNGTSFSNAEITLTGMGNTVDVFSPSANVFAIPVTATVDVAGVGSDTFANTLYVFSNQPSESGGFTDGVKDLIVEEDASFGTYDLSSSFSPVTGPVFFNGNNPYATTSGSIQITGATTATFEADVQAVPEPASMAALGLGGLALLRRRRA